MVRASVPNNYSLADDIRNDPEKLRLVFDYNLHAAAQARENMGAFFEYVIREETTREPIKLAPHQKVALDFIWHHPKCIVMMPPGFSKTFLTTAMTLYLLGLDPTLRGAIISSAEDQSMKPLGSVRSYIENSAELRAVFPGLRRSLREGDPWTQTKITVERPFGIRDPSLVALGLGGAILGARLSWMVIDDLLTEENTRTKEQRDQVFDWVQITANSRIDIRRKPGSLVEPRLIITNTAYHPEDFVHRFRDQLGWPTLRMGASGDIHVEGGDLLSKTWGVSDAIAKEFRHKTTDPYEVACRLTAHDPDPQNLVPLWPALLDRAALEHKKRYEMLPLQWENVYEQNCRDDATAPCKIEYIERCKQTARDLGITSLFRDHKSESADSAFTGVDLSTGEGSDETYMFTFYVRTSDRIRVILDIRGGMWGAPQIAEELEQVLSTYNSVARVESNGSQKFLRQIMQAKNRGLPIIDHNTDATKKMDPVFGIHRLFVDMRNGAWAIPTDRQNRMDSRVQKFVDACLFFRPAKHTPDVLMAAHLAMAQAAEWGVFSPPSAGDAAAVQATGASIMSR